MIAKGKTVENPPSFGVCSYCGGRQYFVRWEYDGKRIGVLYLERCPKCISNKRERIWWKSGGER